MLGKALFVSLLYIWSGLLTAARTRTVCKYSKWRWRRHYWPLLMKTRALIQLKGPLLSCMTLLWCIWVQFVDMTIPFLNLLKWLNVSNKWRDFSKSTVQVDIRKRYVSHTLGGRACLPCTVELGLCCSFLSSWSPGSEDGAEGSSYGKLLTGSLIFGDDVAFLVVAVMGWELPPPTQTKVLCQEICAAICPLSCCPMWRSPGILWSCSQVRQEQEINSQTAVR